MFSRVPADSQVQVPGLTMVEPVRVTDASTASIHLTLGLENLSLDALIAHAETHESPVYGAATIRTADLLARNRLFDRCLSSAHAGPKIRAVVAEVAGAIKAVRDLDPAIDVSYVLLKSAAVRDYIKDGMIADKIWVSHCNLS